MRKVWLVLFGLFLCVDGVNAALRVQNAATPNASLRQSASARVKSESSSNRNTVSRAATNGNSRTTTARTASNKVVTGRTTSTKTTARNTAYQKASRVARAAATVATRTFGSNYNSCRDAYFTCMDQFCATQNESYRRCVCSSKLKDIQSKEKLLTQTSNSLKDFEDLNINVITKTAGEAKAMLSASEGEAAMKKDRSQNANNLKNISDVLDTTKSESLSTQGKLDIAGDIKSIWTTTNLIGGSDIANLTGESLFNAVHAQCSELVAESCADSDLKMVSSAYGMYIENDCSLLETNLKNKTVAANAAIRSTRHKMQDTRLENYDAHNSVNINDCIAKVRNDVTADAACGNGYIHCLDFSGKYLNISTGAPIYSAEFYQIENQISLSGDVLTNSKNTAFINALDKKRSFASQSLDLCRDNADDVWNEFLRQALVEIYQGQQQRVKLVKDECLQVVNDCYLKQSDQLKNFSGSETKINLGQTLELSEEMCADKLQTCSNLYGGGDSGLEILVATMTSITDMTIEQSCHDLLTEFSKNICAVQYSDSAHSYPYGCRKYAPGEARFARFELCNSTIINPFSKTNILLTYVADNNVDAYARVCSINASKRYTSCKYGFYLYSPANAGYDKDNATECRLCPATSVCPGGVSEPINADPTLYEQCGEYYVGSLYQQMVIFALQNCTRPSNTSSTVSDSLLADIDMVMKDVRTQLIASLSKECSDQYGIWVDVPWTDTNGDGIHDVTGDSLKTDFYITTGANALWGYCKK